MQIRRHLLQLVVAAAGTIPVIANAQGYSGTVPSACPADDSAPFSSDARVIVVAENHGTKEYPRLAARMLCKLASKDRPLILGVEMSSRDLQAINAYLAKPAPNEQDLAELTKAELWRLPGDGRGSEAMAELIATARALKAQGLPVYVDAYSMGKEDIPFPLTPDEQVPEDEIEQFRASHIRYRLEAYPQARYLVLSGGLHAYRTVGRSRDPEHRSMVVRLLPHAKVYVIAGTWQKGNVWDCRFKNGALNCGERTFDAPGRSAPADKVDETVDLGELHASHPFARSVERAQ